MDIKKGAIMAGYRSQGTGSQGAGCRSQGARYIIVLLILLCNISVIAGSDIYINDTKIIYAEIYGGSDLITPIYHIWDEHFIFLNEDNIDYSIYMYNYVGRYPINYTDAFIGIVKPKESITLNSNASYYIYAEYIDRDNLKSEEFIREGLNQYWLIFLVFIILLIGLYTIIRMVLR